MDLLTKYCHFGPLKHPYTTRAVAEVFAKEVIRLHGMPISVVSDRDPILSAISGGTCFICREMGGQTEVVNCCLEMYLCCVIVVADHPRSWLYWVPWTEF